MKLEQLLHELKQTQEKLHTSPVLLCGGACRDAYLNNLSNIEDLDLTTGDKSVQYLAEEFFVILAKRFNALKKSHEDGHISIYLGNLKLDFSSNFILPNVKKYIKLPNPTSLQQEMFSRDFTCNALLMSLSLDKVYDPTHQGFEDIDKKLIKTCLSPEITLTSNKNRVIRSIYLACKLGFDIDQSIIDFVKTNPTTVQISTPKTVVEKLNKSFEKDPDRASDLLSRMNLWKYIPINTNIYPYYMKNSK